MAQQSQTSEKKLTAKIVKQELAGLGLSMKATGEHGNGRPEFVIKFKDDRDPDHGYFSDDLQDLLDTGHAMANFRRQHPPAQASAEIYDPLRQNQPQFISTASATINNPPRSPISGELMRQTTVGAFGQVPFKAWVSLTDRIVLPMRE